MTWLPIVVLSGVRWSGLKMSSGEIPLLRRILFCIYLYTHKCNSHITGQWLLQYWNYAISTLQRNQENVVSLLIEKNKIRNASLAIYFHKSKILLCIEWSVVLFSPVSRFPFLSVSCFHLCFFLSPKSLVCIVYGTHRFCFHLCINFCYLKKISFSPQHS